MGWAPEKAIEIIDVTIKYLVIILVVSDSRMLMV